jgi:hypothetical protein
VKEVHHYIIWVPKTQRFMTPFSDRDAVSTWIPAVRNAEKVIVHPYPPRNECHSGHVLTSISGKTSLILSLAGELGLDIYVASLSSKGCVFVSFPLIIRLNSAHRMSDNTLMTLIGDIPSP